MKIKYYDHGKSIDLELWRESDGRVFHLIADELSKKFKVKWVEKIEGIDQRYWDFKFKGILLTLHLEHYTGIMIFADKSNPDIKQATDLLYELGNYFKTWNLPKEIGKL